MNNREFLGEKLAKIDAENNSLTLELGNLEKKISHLEQDKKKFAGQKKFKEA